MSETGSLFCGHDHKAKITLKKTPPFSRSAFEENEQLLFAIYLNPWLDFIRKQNGDETGHHGGSRGGYAGGI